MSKNYNNPPPVHPNTVQIMEKGAPPIRRQLKPKSSPKPSPKSSPKTQKQERPTTAKSASVKRAVAEGRKSSSPKTVKKPSKLSAATKPPKRKGKK